MNNLWISLYFLSMSWLFIIPVFTPGNYGWLPMVLCGIYFGILAFRNTIVDKIDTKWTYSLLPLGISSVLIPFPYNVSSIILFIGIAVTFLFKKKYYIGLGVIFSGIILSVQTASIPFYFSFASRYHRIDAMAPLVNFFLRILGMKTHVYGSTIFVQDSSQVHIIATTWEKFGLLSVLAIFLGGLVTLLLTSERKWKSVAFSLILVGYIVVRYVFLMLLFIDNGKISLFWMPTVTAISFVPLFIILTIIVPLQGRSNFVLQKLPHRIWLIGGLTFLSACFLAGIWGYHSSGTQKIGRVLMDEKHSNWELTTEKYDTKWFGEKSGYNYYCLYSYLDLYYRIDRNFKPITPDLLSNYDILIIKTPTEPFAEEEMQSIEAFVKNGGGLFLIGDHTNVFGTSTNINPLARRFGFRFRHNSTYDLNTGSLTEYQRPRLLPHPIVQRMPSFLFGTSCTLEAPLFADEVINGYSLKAVDADYSQKNFFPTKLETADMEFGLFLQAAATYHGRGRVVAFTDSTVFSNFWMFMPGKPELALGAMEWLNRKGSYPYARTLCLITGLALMFLAMLIASRQRNSTTLFVMVTAAALGAGVFTNACGFINESNYPLPQPHKRAIRVCFEQEHSDFILPATLAGFTSNESQKQFHTFYVWTQRLGYVPSVEPTLRDALANGDIVVMINPKKNLTADENDAMVKFIEKGGKIILLDSALRTDSVTNEVLKIGGMRMEFKPVGRSIAHYGDNKQVQTTLQAGRISGGRPLVITDNSSAIMSVSKKGRGEIAAFADSSLFNYMHLGDVGSLPNEYQKQISDLEFWIFSYLRPY